MENVNKSPAILPARYSVAIYGQLSENWGYGFSGTNISFSKQVDDSHFTHLTIDLANGAVLIEVLNALYNLGYPLLSVRCEDD